MSGKDGLAGDEAAFAEFAAQGDVEVGDTNLASAEESNTDDAAATKNRQQRRAERTGKANREAAKTAAAAKADGAGDDDGDEGDAGDADENADDQGDENGDEDEDEQKPSESHLKRLKRERAEAKKEARELKARLATLEGSGLVARLEALEKGGLPNSGAAGKSGDQGTPAPDPTDTEKYPLGHLDDRYIEDKLEWLAEKKATERADAVLQRQQEGERNTNAQAAQQVLLDKVDDLAERGSDLHDDYQEIVVEAGMRGDWDLSQTTFEACHEAEHGAQILLDLANDKKEATRVAKLSHLAQLRYVEEKNAEIDKVTKPRRIPRAGEPPQNAARGANSRTQINPATDNLDDFEKAWQQDEKKSKR